MRLLWDVMYVQKDQVLLIIYSIMVYAHIVKSCVQNTDSAWGPGDIDVIKVWTEGQATAEDIDLSTKGSHVTIYTARDLVPCHTNKRITLNVNIFTIKASPQNISSSEFRFLA